MSTINDHVNTTGRETSNTVKRFNRLVYVIICGKFDRFVGRLFCIIEVVLTAF